jgi:adenylylsulfate kinase
LAEGYVLWFTGLSGAGKSTVAGLVGAELRRRNVPLEVLDGDEVRTHLSKGLGFSRADRDTNILRIGWVAGLLSRHGVAVITAAISPYAGTRAQVRAMTTNFVEIYVDAPLAACEARDVKGLYARARAGEIAEFTGVSDPYEPPTAPEVHLRTDHESPAESAARVLAYVDERGWAGPGGGR